MRNVANNLIGSILIDKSSTIFLPSKVHRGDRIKLFSIDPTSSVFKEKVVQIDQLEKSYVIAVRGQPSLASGRVCSFAPGYQLKGVYSRSKIVNFDAANNEITVEHVADNTANSSFSPESFLRALDLRR